MKCMGLLPTYTEGMLCHSGNTKSLEFGIWMYVYHASILKHLSAGREPHPHVQCGSTLQALCTGVNDSTRDMAGGNRPFSAARQLEHVIAPSSEPVCGEQCHTFLKWLQGSPDCMLQSR